MTALEIGQPSTRTPRMYSFSSLLVVLGLLVPIAGGRWGSYLSVPATPLFLADILFLSGVALHILRWVEGRSSYAPVPRALVTGSVVLALTATLATVLSISSPSILIARDAAPFVYLAAAPVVFRAITDLTPEKAVGFLRIACGVHAVWFALATFRLLPPAPLPFLSDLPLFTTRGDFDLIICGLTALVFATSRTSGTGTRILFVLLSVTSLFAGGSRAGLAAGLVVLVIGVIFWRPRGAPISPLAVATGAFFVAAALPALVLVSERPPEWMRGLSRILDVGSAEQATAENTWLARTYAWETITNFVLSEPARTWWGTGFGSQPVLESGAVAFLSGDPAVRAAHNFLVTWLAFLGVAGLICIVFALAVWLLAAAKHAYLARGDSGIGFALALGLLLAGLGGVILESPFGYMSFVFAIALAYSEPSTEDNLR